jgi:Fe-S-cluster-containing hydrogenase component 2
MHACPVEAIVYNEQTGSKDVIGDVCVGCKVCTLACPFGTVNYDTVRKIVYKCDLCGGDPACAKACPTQAITYVDAEHTGLARMRAHAAKNLPHAPAKG